ncbi:hypothetical protein HPB52_007578 [Rhipicephalus sanguineus]|uniref:Uncharacterized protein n=1 Tax=Rhipicephalus sanguineus TaxID=34632 RepID=A0A9D4PFC4_RHISA|nr:hypothetical protein HPB52_007578 [Rhipicephalus sanguineus]
MQTATKIGCECGGDYRSRVEPAPIVEHKRAKKTHSNNRINKLLHDHAADLSSTFNNLASKHMPPPTQIPMPDYVGAPNEELGRPITEAEGMSTAPGPDSVTNKTLRNLNDQSISKLTEYYNHCLEKGEIPQAK